MIRRYVARTAKVIGDHPRNADERTPAGLTQGWPHIGFLSSRAWIASPTRDLKGGLHDTFQLPTAVLI
jgi:hypothetical protein